MSRPNQAEMESRYVEYVRQRKLMRLQHKHRITKEESDEKMKRFLNDTLELFSRIGSVYESSEGITVCSLRGKR